LIFGKETYFHPVKLFDEFGDLFELRMSSGPEKFK